MLFPQPLLSCVLASQGWVFPHDSSGGLSLRIFLSSEEREEFFFTVCLECADLDQGLFLNNNCGHEVENIPEPNHNDRQVKREFPEEKIKLLSPKVGMDIL